VEGGERKRRRTRGGLTSLGSASDKTTPPPSKIYHEEGQEKWGSERSPMTVEKKKGRVKEALTGEKGAIEAVKIHTIKAW